MPSEERQNPAKSCGLKNESNSDNEDNVPFNLYISKKRQQPKKEPTAEVKRETEDEEDDNDRIPISSNVTKKTVKKGVKREAEDDDEMPVANVKGRKTTMKKVKEEVKAMLKDVDKKKSKTVVVKKNGNVREKKVYHLPGQKHDPPEERDPLRIFYESLYQQIPTSEIAAIWMMEWGLLPEDAAAVVYEKKRSHLQAKLRSPVKTNSAVRTATVSVKQKKKVTPAKSKERTSINSNSATNKKSKKRKARYGSSDEDEDEDEDDDDDFAIPLRNVKKQKTSG